MTELLHSPDGNYGFLIHAILGHDITVDLRTSLTYSLPEGRSCRIALALTTPREQAANLTRLRVEGSSFPTAEAAGGAAQEVVTGLCWLAVSKRFAIRFEYSEGAPFAIIPNPGGLEVVARGDVRAFWNLGRDEWKALVGAVVSNPVRASPALALSMELFAASQLEASDSARFIAIVTSLEALATQQALDDDIGKLVNGMVSAANASPYLLEPGQERLKRSFIDRLTHLRKESVRQAIVRTVTSYFPRDEDTLDFVDMAYGLRSDLLHEGRRIEQLNETSARLATVMRRLYAAALGRSLLTAA